MGITKEEIQNAVQIIEEAMEKYAAQHLDEYKENLKSKISVDIELMIANPTDSEAADYGYITALNKVKDLL